MTSRKCGTCKHFEPAPLWRKGWCRNPLLFSPQQSHLVNDEDLDCERGMGNYWEAAESVHVDAPVDISAGFREPVADAFSDRTGNVPLVSDSGQPVYPVMGAAGQGGDRTPYGDPSGGGWSGGGPPNQGDRDYNYYPEERYWTDYLRIAAPILGVILMVLLFWWWISNYLGDDPNDDDIAGANDTPVTLPTTQETADSDPEATPGDETPGIVIPGNETPGADTTPPAEGEPTEPAGDPEPPPEEGEEEVPPSESGIYNGATVEVFNTGGTGLNVRAQPSTDSEIIAVFLDGTALTVIGVAIEAEGLVWWPVSGEGVEGYVVQEYLSLIE